MFNPRQQALLTSGFAIIFVYFIGKIGGIDGGSSLLWGLFLGFALFRLLDQDSIVDGGADLFPGGFASSLNAAKEALGVLPPRETNAPAPGETEAAAPRETEAAAPRETPANANAEAPQEAPSQPPKLEAPRDGQPDDLKRLTGIGPKFERALNDLGYYHFDQIAHWSPSEVEWIDENLPGANGRASSDDWVAQAKTILAE